MPYYQIATVSGHIEPFDGNYRAALAQVNRFAATVSDFEDVEVVTVLKLPLDVSSRQRISGVATATSEVGDALFELRIVLRTRGEPS